MWPGIGPFDSYERPGVDERRRATTITARATVDIHPQTGSAVPAAPTVQPFRGGEGLTLVDGLGSAEGLGSVEAVVSGATAGGVDGRGPVQEPASSAGQ
jgi:hypothetical protein